MKKLALAAAMSFAASTAFAGGLDAPKMEKMVEKVEMVEMTAMTKTMKKSTSKADAIVAPAMFLLLVGVAFSR